MLYTKIGFLNIKEDEIELYRIFALTRDGKELDRSTTYSVMIYTDRDWYIPAIKEAVGFETMNTDVPKAIEYVRKRIVEDGGQLEAPTDYINLQ